MLLRSSSTPILGSLLSSYSESPNHGNHSEFNSPKHLPKKFSFHQTHTSPLHLITPSSISNSSPSFNADFTSNGSHSSQVSGFRRVQSDGNLEGLAASCNSFDEFNHSIPPKIPRNKAHCSVLKTINSFSVYNPKRRFEDDDEQEEDEESGEEAEEERSENYSLKNSMNFMNNVSLQERYIHFQNESENNAPSKMHLAKGLGAFTDGGGYNRGGKGNGGNNEYKQTSYGDDGGDGASMAEHYKKMVVDNPGNPMVLRNYAEFLHKSKDLRGAEEYYSRAILMDPGDGEILSQYAQLTWELHHDEEQTSSYFERAVQASPENSHVLAAYASFLWEKDDEEEEEEDEDFISTIPPILHQNTTATLMT